MLIVGLTSSTATVGVAVARDGELRASRQVVTDRRHAEEITPLLTEALREADCSVAEIDRLAVDVGPGRFTGLRVGLATARGLALACSLPMVGVTSLELLAAGSPGRPVVAVIDARRNEVFQQVFHSSGPEKAVVGPPAELAAAVPLDAVVVGDGADRYHDIYGAPVVLGQAPDATVLVGLAADRTPQNGSEVLPVYLREPDVQVNIKTRPTAGDAA